MLYEKGDTVRVTKTGKGCKVDGDYGPKVYPRYLLDDGGFYHKRELTLVKDVSDEVEGVNKC